MHICFVCYRVCGILRVKQLIATDIGTSQRATNIDQQNRQVRLEDFISHVIQKWQDPVLSESLSSFTGFCDLLGLSNLQDYLIRRKVNQIDDWATTSLDDEGQALRFQMQAARDVSDSGGIQSKR